MSVRQLQRLETGEGMGRIHNDTMRKLTGAFGVTAAVLRGEAPIPAQAAEFPQIDADCLRVVREGRGMSRAELAEVSGVSERNLARLESSGRRVQPATLDALAGALKTDARILTGRGAVRRPSHAAPQGPQAESLPSYNWHST